MWLKMEDGVTRSRMAPTIPPASEITNRVRNDSPAAPATCSRPAKLEVTWPGNSAMVEVMLAAQRAVMLVSINAGRVKKVPPPANAFWMPAHTATAKRI